MRSFENRYNPEVPDDRRSADRKILIMRSTKTLVGSAGLEPATRPL
jgi:hypothetical protein